MTPFQIEPASGQAVFVRLKNGQTIPPPLVSKLGEKGAVTVTDQDRKPSFAAEPTVNHAVGAN